MNPRSKYAIDKHIAETMRRAFEDWRKAQAQDQRALDAMRKAGQKS
jgi:hypothetical protein